MSKRQKNNIFDCQREKFDPLQRLTDWNSVSGGQNSADTTGDFAVDSRRKLPKEHYCEVRFTQSLKIFILNPNENQYWTT